MKALALCLFSLTLGGYLASQVDAMQEQASIQQALAAIAVCTVAAFGCLPLLTKIIR